MNKFINDPRSFRLPKGAAISDSRSSISAADSYQDAPDFCYPQGLRKLPKGWRNEDYERTPKKASLRPSSAVFDTHKRSKGNSKGKETQEGISRLSREGTSLEKKKKKASQSRSSLSYNSSTFVAFPKPPVSLIIERSLSDRRGLRTEATFSKSLAKSSSSSKSLQSKKQRNEFSLQLGKVEESSLPMSLREHHKEEIKVSQPSKISKMHLGFVFEKQAAVIKKCGKPQKTYLSKQSPLIQKKDNQSKKQLPPVPNHQSPLLEGLVTELKKYQKQPYSPMLRSNKKKKEETPTHLADSQSKENNSPGHKAYLEKLNCGQKSRVDMAQHLPCTRSYPPQKKPIPSANFFFNNDLLEESQQRNISNELIMSSILENQAKQLERKMNHVIVDSRNDLQQFVSADTGGQSYNVAEEEVIEQATEENMEDSDGSDVDVRNRGRALFEGDSDQEGDDGSWGDEEFKGESINYTSRDLSPRSTEEAEISERELNLEMLSTERKKRKTNLTLEKSPKPVNAETRHECREIPIWEQGVQEVEEPVTFRIERPIQEWEIFDEKPILHPASFIPAAHDHSEVNHQKSRNVKESLFYQREGDASTTQTSSGGHLHRSKMNSISVLPASRFENKLVQERGNEEETGLSLMQQRKRKARHCHRRTQSKTFDPSFVSALLTNSTAYVEKSNNF